MTSFKYEGAKVYTRALASINASTRKFNSERSYSNRLLCKPSIETLQELLVLYEKIHRFVKKIGHLSIYSISI